MTALPEQSQQKISPSIPDKKSLLTTMFVPLNSSPTPQPLSPTCSLTESSTCVSFNFYRDLETPSPTQFSPAVKALRHDLNAPINTAPRNAKTKGQFRPRNANKGTSSYQLRAFAEATLGSGSLRKAVKLPEGEDLNEWLAVNGKMSLRTIVVTPADRMQCATSTIRSTYSTARSPSSALRKHVQR